MAAPNTEDTAPESVVIELSGKDSCPLEKVRIQVPNLEERDGKVFFVIECSAPPPLGSWLVDRQVSAGAGFPPFATPPPPPLRPPHVPHPPTPPTPNPPSSLSLSN